MKIKSNLSYTLATIGAFGFLPLTALASIQDYAEEYKSEIGSISKDGNFCSRLCDQKKSTFCTTKTNLINCFRACTNLPMAATTLPNCIQIFEQTNPLLKVRKKDSSAENEELRKQISELQKQLNKPSTPNVTADTAELRTQITELKKQLELAKANSSLSASGSSTAINLNLTSDQAQRYIDAQIAAGKLTVLELKSLEDLQKEYDEKSQKYNKITGTDPASELARGTLEKELSAISAAIDKEEDRLKAIAEKKRKAEEQEAKNKAYRDTQAKQLVEDKQAYESLAQPMDLLQNNGSALLQKIANVKDAENLNQSIENRGTYSEHQRKALRYIAQRTINEGKESPRIQNQLKSLVTSINRSLEVRSAPSSTPKKEVLTSEETADKAAYEAIKNNLAQGKIKLWLANDGQVYKEQLKVDSSLKKSYIDSQNFEKDIAATGADPARTIQALRYFTSRFLQSGPAEKQRTQAENIKVDLTNLLAKVKSGYKLKAYPSTKAPALLLGQSSSNAAQTGIAVLSETQEKASSQKTSSDLTTATLLPGQTTSASSGGFADEISMLGQIKEKAGVTNAQAKKILKIMKKNKNLTMSEAITEFQKTPK